MRKMVMLVFISALEPRGFEFPDLTAVCIIAVGSTS